MNHKKHLTHRDYTPPPLAYPYAPFPGAMPLVVRDRFIFAAFEARKSNTDLGVFMIRSWENFRFPHIKMMHFLLELGFVRRCKEPMFGESFEWI